jgi:hypothetical protein
MAAIFEHSGPDVHNLGQDQPENSNGLFRSVPNPCMLPRDRAFLSMPIREGESKVLFFNDLGCSNLQYDAENCLGQMYAMLHSGLVCMGATSWNWNSNSHAKFSEALGNGRTFGQAFLEYVNEPRWRGYDQLVMTLLGAGTLKLEPYVPSASPRLIIKDVGADKVELGPYPGPYLHEDSLTLNAEVDSDPSGLFDPYRASFTWYGLNQERFGNGTEFTLEGHNLPGYQNGSRQGEYFITLHVEQPDCEPACAVLSLQGWTFRKIGSRYYIDPGTNKLPADLNRHYWNDGDQEWEAHIRGLTDDIGGAQDDFVYYFTDIISGDFEVVVRVKNWRNPATATYDEGAKAGVMIRVEDGRHSTGCPNAFMGLTHDKGAVFQYRSEQGGDTTRIVREGYTAGNTWVKLRRTGQKVYGYVSDNGTDFQYVGEMTIGSMAQPYVGFAYACNDSNLWEWSSADFSKERGVVFSDMRVTKLSEPLPVVPFIEYVNEVDGTHTAYFGYNNPNDYAVIVKPGEANNLQGSGDLPEPLGEFQPGRIHGVFAVDFDGISLVWNLQGESATTQGAVVKHLQITPVVEEVIDQCDGTYTVTFGYDNPHDFAVTKERGPLNRLEHSEWGDYYYWDLITDFETGLVHEAFTVEFEEGDLIWRLDGNEAVARGSMAQNVCPPFRLYKAFAFGADSFTREVPNAPGAKYTKVVQNTENFAYDPSRGFGYTDYQFLDKTLNNRDVLFGNDEIYDQFVGVWNNESGYNSIVFRVDVPPGIYRFVAAGGDAYYSGHETTLSVTSGDYDYGGGVTLVEDQVLPANTFYAVGFEDKAPPQGDGQGTQPTLLPLKESPYLRVSNEEYGGYLEIHQIASGNRRVNGGDLCLLELWYISEVSSVTGGEPRGPWKGGYGGQTDEVTEPGVWRWAEWYYGYRGVDEIKWKKDDCGRRHAYAIGWHGGDLIEYLMKFGGEHSRLTLRGIADHVKPVILRIYVDGEPVAEARWTNGDGCNQDMSVEIPEVDYGTHAIAVEFVNDFYDPGRGLDRNMHLDGLFVSESAGISSLTYGEPKGPFKGGDFGEQTDEVTEPGVWRWAEGYYGYRGMDEIRWKEDACGEWHAYAVGWHAGDLIEYLMTFGGDYKYLVLRGKADNPPPVEVEIFVDGESRAKARWEHGDDTSQDIAVEIPEVDYGAHAIAVKFTNDFYEPDRNLDRNLYLDALKASKVGVIKVLSDGTWKSTSVCPPSGWKDSGFDDSGWLKAYAPYPNRTPPTYWVCGTQAVLIWNYPYFKVPDGKDGPDDAWFRKTFTLPVEPSNLQKAEAILAADDDATLYVNGREAIKDWDGTLWGAPYSKDIREYLVKGENVLAVHACDSYGIHEWLLLDVSIE